MKKRMSLLDAAMIRMERVEAPQHASVLLLFKIPPGSPPDYIQRLAQDMRRYPVTAERFNWRLARSPLDKFLPAWDVLAPEEIELDYHFRHSALPYPGGELELGLLVSRLVTHPIDLTRPAWEMHLIEGLENDQFALFAKMHHALVDGMTAMKMLNTWLSADPESSVAPLWSDQASAARSEHKDLRHKDPRHKDGESRSVVDRVTGTVDATRAVGGAIGRTVAAVAGIGDDDLVAPYRPPRTILNGSITQRRRVSTQRIELSRIRQLAVAIDGTVNDAASLLLGGALRRYLTELSELPDKSLVAGVLASLRVASGADSSAGNMISFIFADLATDIDDIAARAERITRSTRAGKDHLLGLKKDAMTYGVLMTAPYVLTSITGSGHLLPAFNVALSNVPGAKRPVYWNGALAEAVHATTIISSGHALIVVATSWNDQFCFTLTACPDAIPHSQRLAVYLADELEEAERVLGLPADSP